MPLFEPTGDMLTDLQSAIETSSQVFIRYVDRKGNPSERNIGPIEIRGDRIYAQDVDKQALRLFILANIESYQVLDATFDKDATLST